MVQRSIHSCFRSAGSRPGRLGLPGLGSALLTLCWVGAQGAAWAQAQPATVSADAQSDVGRSTRQWLDDAVAKSQMGGMPLRLEVEVGQLDDRLRLAPCSRVEPYLPPGLRLWGRTRIGLRCVEGPVRWNVFLPVTVKAWGPAWVLKSGAQPGMVLSLDDAMESEVDWAAEPSPVLADATQWVGQQASRLLIPGQALRQSMVRPTQAFSAGTQVRVVAEGPGFQITSDGQAMGAGVIGQNVRVRMDNGRIMSGLVLDKNTVKIEI